MAVDRQRRIWLVAREYLVDRLPSSLQCRIVERTLGEHRRVARCVQQDVAVTQRHLELLGQVQHHVAAWL